MPVLGLVLIGVLAAVVLIGAAPPPDQSSPAPTLTETPMPGTEAPVTERQQAATPPATATPTPTPTPAPTPEPQLTASRVEHHVHEYINAARADEGLGELDHSSDLREIARYHSEDMAERDYFSHESPEGDDFSDRYEQFGYDCRAPASGNTYYTGAENIAYTYYQENLVGGDYHATPRELAQGVVEQWMDSPGHRRNILMDEWRNEGIGVAIEETEEGTRVYVTQNFC